MATHDQLIVDRLLHEMRLAENHRVISQGKVFKREVPLSGRIKKERVLTNMKRTVKDDSILSIISDVIDLLVKVDKGEIHLANKIKSRCFGR